MSICGATDTPVLDFWWCFLGFKARVGSALFTLGGGVCNIRSLRFTSGATPLPVYNASIAASCLPHMRVSAEVECRNLNRWPPARQSDALPTRPWRPAQKKPLNFNTTTPLITYRFSSTSTPPSAPASCPSSSPPFTFQHCCFWKFSKNWKEEGDNMQRKHVVLRFKTQITCPHRGQQRLCTWQWTKIKIQWQLIWPLF